MRYKFSIVRADAINHVTEFRLRKPNQTEDWQGVLVHWYEDRQRAHCNKCSGPLTAMSSSCNHAKALKRFMTKGNTTVKTPPGGQPFKLADVAAGIAKAEAAERERRNALHFERDEYFRDVLYGLTVGKSIHIATPWGLWGIKMVSADGTLEVYLASHGPAQRIHVAPKVTNLVEIIPVKV